MKGKNVSVLQSDRLIKVKDQIPVSIAAAPPEIAWNGLPILGGLEPLSGLSHLLRRCLQIRIILKDGGEFQVQQLLIEEPIGDVYKRQTLGWTMPAPSSSIQPSPLQVGQPTPPHL